MNFVGPAKKLTDIDLPRLGARLGVGEDEIHAVLDVESRGAGFDEKNRPRILFERHKFYKYVPDEKRTEAMTQGLASPKAGGYGKESEQYGKLERAMKIDEIAALKSCSWGLGQIMGFNHLAAGYPNVKAMIEAFKLGEAEQLEGMVNFILFNKLDDELRRHDWAGFAAGYNGSDFARNQYDKKLAERYVFWRAKRDTPWPPKNVENTPSQLPPGGDPVKPGADVPATVNPIPRPPETPEKARPIWGFILLALAMVAGVLYLIFRS